MYAHPLRLSRWLGSSISGAILTLLGCLTAAASPERPETDCFATWSVVSECEDGDPGCDADPGRGCGFTAQLCFGDSGSQCTAAPLERFGLRRPRPTQANRENIDAVLGAVTDLGGRRVGRTSVRFATPLAGPICTEDFVIEVAPLEGLPRPSRAEVRSVARSGRKSDRDALTLTCHRPSGAAATALSTGCNADMNKTQCEAHAGLFVEKAGLLGLPICFCEADDAGKGCKRQYQCQGLCAGASSASTEGSCTSHVNPLGCFFLVGFYGSPAAPFFCAE